MTSSAQNSKQVLAQKGSAATPSYSFLGNNVTGWYLSATNEISASTNSTQRLVIDSSGNVGIGAASPTSITKFYVEQSAGNVLGYFNSTAASQNARVRINSTDTASSVAYVWSYSNASLNKQASIYLTGTGALATQVGQTAGAEPTTGTTAMFIDSSGNVGVGTSSPATKLQVAGEIRNSSDLSNSADPIVYSYNGAAAGTVQSGIQFVGSGQNTRFYTASTERMRITSAGGVSFGSSGTAYGTSGQVLTSAGNAPPTWTTISTSASGTLIRAPQILTSGTSYTTPSNCTRIYVEAVGGGGNGGQGSGSTNNRSGGGGGGGGYSAKYFTVTGSTAYTYAIGAGGGGNTTFTVGATTITGGGGSVGGGSTNNGPGSGGAGGTGSGGDFNFAGGGGGGGAFFSGTSNNVTGGVGGSSHFGGGGASTLGAGTSGGNYGAGASGSANTTGSASGAQGVIRIWEFT